MGQKGFNLLQPQSAPPTFWDKVYAWVLGTARVIIIIVEAFVLVLFGTRFVLDTQTKNLNESIEFETIKLESLAETEAGFRTTQNKLGAYKESWESANAYSGVIREVNTFIPTLPEDIRIQIADDSLIIRGFANLSSVSALENSLKTSDSFLRTEVFEIQEQGGGQEGGVFAVRAILNNYKGRTL